MNEVLKAIKELLKKGFATVEEKANLATKVKELSNDDQAASADDVEKVNDLPEKEEAGSKDKEEEEELEKGIKSLFKNEANSIKKELKSDISKFLEEQEELREKKAGAYHTDLKGKRKELSSHMRELTKAFLGGDEAKMKEMTTDDTGSPYAGYTVDQELSAEIRHLITEYGVARREMTTIPLTKGSYKANNLATDVTVYWVDEGAVVGSTQVVLGNEELTLQKLGAIVTLTSELLEDTEIDFVSFLGSRVAEGMAQAEDQAFFIGDGTATYGSFTGLLENSSINEVVMATGNTGFSDVTAEDLLDMQDATPSGAMKNAKYYIHRTNMSYVRKLREDAVTGGDGAGAFIYQAPSERGPAMIWGAPVVMVEAFPAKTDTAVSTSFVLFGDLRKACILGYKASGLKVSRFNSGVVRNVADSSDINLITTDREAVRWLERTGYITILPEAVTKLTTSAT